MFLSSTWATSLAWEVVVEACLAGALMALVESKVLVVVEYEAFLVFFRGSRS